MKRKLMLQLHRGAITDLHFSGELVFSSSADSTLAVTQLDPPKFVGRVCSPTPINAFYVNDDEYYYLRLLIGGDSSLSLYDWDFYYMASIKLNYNVTSLACCLSRYYIFAGGDDGAVRIYDLALLEIAVMRGHTGPVFAVQAGQNGVFTAGGDGKIIKWDFAGTAQRTSCFKHPIYDLCISQNGRYMACCKSDGEAMVLNVEEGFKVVYRVQQACGQRFLQRVKMGLVQGKQCVLCANMARIRYFDVQTRQLNDLEDPEIEKSVIYALEIQGSKLALGGYDGRIGVYELV